MITPGTSLHRAQVQFQLIAIWLFNRLLRITPGHLLRVLLVNAAGAKISTNSALHSGCYFTRPGRMAVGPHSTINFGCYLDTRGGIQVGSNVMIGHRVRIYTAGHSIDDPAFGGYTAAVTIHDNAVIFPNALLMPGVTIGEGAVVLTGSVVSQDVAAFCVVGGNPAKSIRQRNQTIAYTHRYKVWLPNT